MKKKKHSQYPGIFFLLASIAISFLLLYNPLTTKPINDVPLSEKDFPIPHENYDAERISLERQDTDVMGTSTNIPAGYIKIPVLMYHNIGAMPKNGSSYYKGMFVTPYGFEQQMKYLVANKYKTLTPQQFYNYLKSGKNPPQKSVLITFDDGSRGQYTYAYPILKKYKLTATFYIISEKLIIKANELKQMAKNGMIIDSHSATHPDLSKLKYRSEIKKQVKTSKQELETITGKAVTSIAYPGCVANSAVFDHVASAKYLLGFSCGRSIYHTFKNRLYLSRVHIFNDLSSFKRTLEVGLY